MLKDGRAVAGDDLLLFFGERFGEGVKDFLHKRAACHRIRPFDIGTQFGRRLAHYGLGYKDVAQMGKPLLQR